MSIESILETAPFGIVVEAGELATAAIGNVTIGVTDRTNWLAGDVIIFIDDNGIQQHHTIESVDAILDEVDVYQAPRAVASGGAANLMYKVTTNSCLFQSDTTYPNNTIYRGDGANPQLLSDPTGLSLISVNEGILIKSVYIRLPYQFTFAETNFEVRFATRDPATPTAFARVPSIGEAGIINIPLENNEIPINAYVSPDANAVGTGLPWSLYAYINNAKGQPIDGVRLTPPNAAINAMVSSVNVPASVEFRYLPVIIGVRILHAAVVGLLIAAVPRLRKGYL